MPARSQRSGLARKTSTADPGRDGPLAPQDGAQGGRRHASGQPSGGREAENEIGLQRASTRLEGRREQLLASLAKANAVRCGRAQLKRDLTAGRVEIAEILARPPAHAEGAKVQLLLLAVPGLGRARVGHLLRRCQISESQTAAALSERERSELVRRLVR